MSSDYRPQTEIDDSEFRNMILPSGRPPGSLTDLQYIYGMILSLGHQSTDKAAGDNYSPYLTPMEASAVRGQEQGIVYLDVKLNRKTKTLTPIGSTVVTGQTSILTGVRFRHTQLVTASTTVSHRKRRKTVALTLKRPRTKISVISLKTS